MSPNLTKREAGRTAGIERSAARRAYRHKRILIISDSQAALKALSSQKVTSRRVAECLDSLSALANRIEVTFIGVLGHCGIPGKEEADEIIKQGATMTVLNPEPVLGIPILQQEEK